MTRIWLGMLAALAVTGVSAQQNRIDVVRHDAPELAYYGEYDIGVRTLVFSNPNQADIVNTSNGGETVYYERRLIVEVWYPAQLAENQESGSSYTTATRNLSVTATLHGKAVREAEPLADTDPMPLLIISHGYPGNRYLMSQLAENLASKGYVVAAIDHRDSTYSDQSSIWSTLHHRPLDQIFVVDKIDELSKANKSFLNGLVDPNNVGIVGYSMGGYGLLVNLGAGYNDATVATAEGIPIEVASRHAASNPEFVENLDPRLKAGFAIAPCCMNRGMWNPADLKRVTKPLFFLAGSSDNTAGYETGTRAIFENTSNSDRYLLTYLNAGHNAIAPIPLPIEIQESTDQAGAFHYTDAVWDSVRSSNIMIHFATAFFDYNLKGDATRLPYLQLVPNSEDGVYAIQDGQESPEHNYWKGFPQYTARGLLLEHLEAVE
jgi:predicted dienelactone hydrolase